MSLPLSTFLQQSIRQNYDLAIKSTMSIGAGVMSTTMKLMTEQGALFLKIYKSDQNQRTVSELDLRRIAFTHAVQNFLHQNGFPIPCLLPNREGETFSVCSLPETAQIYALSEFVEGNDYEIANPDQLRSAGEILGRLHKNLHENHSIWRLRYESPPSGSIETEIFAQLIDRLSRLQSVVDDSEAAPVLPSQIERWLHEVEQFNTNRQLRTVGEWIIHGDYRAQNLKFDGGGVVAILDLDAACPADRLYDLGYALVFFPAVYQDTPLTSNQQSVFLRAYESICPLSEIERKMLPTHLHLAFLRGITLWLDLYYFAGMSERMRPWIHGYLHQMDEIFAFWYEVG